jgi:undecaprenyl-diphosphatase
MGLFSGINREDATRFSFLLGIPITLGAVLKVFTDGSNLSTISSEKTLFLVGMVSAFASGLFAIQFMLRYLAKHKLNVFAYYRIVFAIIILLVSIL